MLAEIIEWLASQPRIYDLVQYLAGSSAVRERLARHTWGISPSALVLDVGGGTGLNRGLLPSACTYVCLDNDALKVKGFLKKYPGGTALLGDAAHIPFQSASVDVVLCTFVSHHIPDGLLELLFGESLRVLKRTGSFIFLDVIWDASCWAGRLLWRYDRGNYPRTVDALYSAISCQFEIVHWERFAVYHEYVLCMGKPPR